MGRENIERLLDGLKRAAAELPDKRKASNGRKYEIAEAVMSGFAVFYFQHPSLLNFMQTMESRRKRNNLRTLFGVEKIPSNVQIKNLLDDIEPQNLNGAFDYALEVAREAGVLEQYRVLKGTMLAAMDGTWYFASHEIRCDHCLRIEKEGETLYYHDMLAGAIVKPGSKVVLPLIPEFIRNEDGSEKQDCERNAAKRWLTTHKERYSSLKLTLLGDDLYACHPICAAVLDAGMHFLFTCKDESHPWIAEQVRYAEVEQREERTWNGRSHLVYRYKWVNGLENRAEGEKLPVSYLDFEIYNEEQQKRTYHNSWITSHVIDMESVKNIADCARARWKIENEHNNILKRRGYNLEHNFGHGKNHANEIFCQLNLLAFLFHGIQDHVDEDYRKARGSFGRRDDFFAALRYEVSRYLHENWHDLLLTVAGLPPDG
jgi:hypothetical protein